MKRSREHAKLNVLLPIMLCIFYAVMFDERQKLVGVRVVAVYLAIISFSSQNLYLYVYVVVIKTRPG